MEKHTSSIYIIILIAGFLGIMATAPFIHANVYDRTDAPRAEEWDDVMEASVEGESFVYRAVLPEEEVDHRVVACRSAHMSIEVFIDKTMVYSMESPEKGYTRTTGYNWIFVTLNPEDAGKELVFRITPIYNRSKHHGEFYYGMRSAVEHLILEKYIVRFAVAILIFLTGIVLLVYSLLIAKNNQGDSNLFHLAVFAILLGTWYICESQLLQLILSRTTGLVLAAHLVLMLMPIPFLSFIRQIYSTKDHFLWDINCWLHCGVALVRIFLQAFGILDVSETLWMTHVSLALAAATVLAVSLFEFIFHKLTKRSKLNIVCILVSLVAILLEFIEYRMRSVTRYHGSIAFLFYILIMGSVMIQDARKMMLNAKEGVLYRKLAFTDELTGALNRTAFNRDMKKRCRPETGGLQPTVLFMFDLNDLKKCNDGFGHEYGDRYIRTASEIITSVFGNDGKCYRIGGDEFCVMSDDMPDAYVQDKCRQFRQEVAEKNKQPFVVPISIAVGYAHFDAKRDISLDATMKRADEMMYKNKQELKKRQ